LILLLIFVLRTSASDCLETVCEITCTVSSGTLNLTHSLSQCALYVRACVVGCRLTCGSHRVCCWLRCSAVALSLVLSSISPTLIAIISARCFIYTLYYLWLVDGVTDTSLSDAYW